MFLREAEEAQIDLVMTLNQDYCEQKLLSLASDTLYGLTFRSRLDSWEHPEPQSRGSGGTEPNICRPEKLSDKLQS